MGGSFSLQNPHCREYLTKTCPFEWRGLQGRFYWADLWAIQVKRVGLGMLRYSWYLSCGMIHCSTVTWRASAEEPSWSMKNQLSAWTASSWPCCNSKARSCLRQQAAAASTVAAYSACFPSPWKPRQLLLPPVRAESGCMGFPGHQDHHPSSNCYFLHSFQPIPHPVGWYRSSKPGSLGLSILALLLSLSHPCCLLMTPAQFCLHSWAGSRKLMILTLAKYLNSAVVQVSPTGLHITVLSRYMHWISHLIVHTAQGCDSHLSNCLSTNLEYVLFTSKVLWSKDCPLSNTCMAPCWIETSFWSVPQGSSVTQMIIHNKINVTAHIKCLMILFKGSWGCF